MGCATSKDKETLSAAHQSVVRELATNGLGSNPAYTSALLLVRQRGLDSPGDASAAVKALLESDRPLGEGLPPSDATGLAAGLSMRDVIAHAQDSSMPALREVMSGKHMGAAQKLLETCLRNKVASDIDATCTTGSAAAVRATEVPPPVACAAPASAAAPREASGTPSTRTVMATSTPPSEARTSTHDSTALSQGTGLELGLPPPTVRRPCEVAASNGVEPGVSSTSGAIADMTNHLYGGSAAVAVRHPFTTARKFSYAAVLHGSALVGCAVGAPEAALARVPGVLTPDGCRRVPSFADLQGWVATTGQACGAGLRVLACAARGREPQQPEPLTLVGLIAVAGPAWDVPEATRMWRIAGIRVTMLTGDGMGTAVSIASRCGIGGTSPVALDGNELRAMSDSDVRSVLPSLSIVSRATPLDKLRVVGLVHEDMRRVVAVTGDGTNDAPAPQTADVGFTLNLDSDVAEGASDMMAAAPLPLAAWAYCVVVGSMSSVVCAAVRWAQRRSPAVRRRFGGNGANSECAPG